MNKQLITRRNHDLWLAVRNEFHSMKQYSLNKFLIAAAIRKALQKPAPAFYVSADIAEKKINTLLCGFSPPRSNSPAHQRWLHILSLLRKNNGVRNGTVSRPVLIWLLKTAPAPSFYISYRTARAICGRYIRSMVVA